MITDDQIDCRIQMALNQEIYQFKRVELQRLCKELKLDAIKHGMELAAERIRKHKVGAFRRSMDYYADDILTASQNIKVE